MIIAAILIAFVPILGRLQTLVLGAMSLSFVLGILDKFNPEIVKDNVEFIPGIWFSLGLLVIGGILSWVGTFVAVTILTGMKMEDGLVEIAIMPIVAVFGFIPLCMYGAWLGAQVRGGF